MPRNPPRLDLVEVVDLPVVEASGVAVRRTDHGPVVLMGEDPPGLTATTDVCVSSLR